MPYDKSSVVYHQASLRYTKAGEYDKSEILLKLAIQVAPANYPALIDLMMLRFNQLKQYRSVLNDCIQLISYPNIGYCNRCIVFRFQGQALLQLQEIENAPQAFVRVIQAAIQYSAKPDTNPHNREKVTELQNNAVVILDKLFLQSSSDRLFYDAIVYSIDNRHIEVVDSLLRLSPTGSNPYLSEYCFCWRNRKSIKTILNAD